MSRVFNKNAYKHCDEKARNAVACYLDSKGYQVISNEEDYKVDLIACHPVGHEFEIREIWDNPWPYPTIHIPLRKHKVIKNNPLCFFWILNNECTKSYVAFGKDVARSKKISLMANGVRDEFFDVPTEYFSLIQL